MAAFRFGQAAGLEESGCLVQEKLSDAYFKKISNRCARATCLTHAPRFDRLAPRRRFELPLRYLLTGPRMLACAQAECTRSAEMLRVLL